MHREPRFGVNAKYLLDLYLELRGLVSNLDEWNVDALASNPPRLVRIKRIKAVFAGFGIPWDPKGFAQGSFIRDDDVRYHKVIDELLDELDQFAGVEPVDEEHLQRLNELSRRSWLNDASALRMCFANLFGYRCQVERVLTFFDGWTIANGLCLYPIQKTHSMRESIAERVEAIDRPLELMIDPERRILSIQLLVQRYGYDSSNVNSIDSDWP